MSFFKTLFFSYRLSSLRLVHHNNSKVIIFQKRYFNMHSSQLLSFHENDEKAGYKKKVQYPSLYTMFKEGRKLVKPELKKFRQEMYERFNFTQINLFEHGDYEIPWSFDTQQAVDSWVCTSDSDHGEGNSKSKFEFTKNKTGLFSGFLDITPPKDGVLKFAGYCNITSPKAMKSFYRKTTLNWECYTHMLLRVRGDGRTYMMIIGLERKMDVLWHEVYNYPIYTRGGPYWQDIKIPFSKFYLAKKGRIMDKQHKLPTDLVTHVGITCTGSYPGQFNLEIDTIGVCCDFNNLTEFDYENYQTGGYAM